MAATVTGHATYTDAPPDSPNRFAPGRALWCCLFEETAAAMHRRDAAACEKWLAAFPENARAAAHLAITRAAATPPE